MLRKRLFLMFAGYLIMSAGQPVLGGEGSLEPGVSGETFLFSAPPRESLEVGRKIYGSIADYLTKVTGRKFVYEASDSWPNYQKSLLLNRYDLVFDGPHFVSWRITQRRHRPLIKIPGDFIFVFLARKDNPQITSVEDLAGRTVCGHAPPNQGTLRMYKMFTNTMRVPFIVNVKGWRNIYKSMIAGTCHGAIVPLKIFREVDQGEAKVLYMTKAVPGQAFTAGPNIPMAIQDQVISALLSTEGQKTTAPLRKRFPTTAYTRATVEEYRGIDELLQGTWKFFPEATVTAKKEDGKIKF